MRGVCGPVMGFHASASPPPTDRRPDVHNVRQCDLSEVQLSHEDWRRREAQKAKYMRQYANDDMEARWALCKWTHLQFDNVRPPRSIREIEAVRHEMDR